jgi:hypothetical protein
MITARAGSSRSSSTMATTASMPRVPSPTGRGRCAATRSPATGPARPAGRRRRHRLHGPDLPAPRRNPGLPQPVRQRLRRPAPAASGVPAARQPGPRHGDRPARPRHRVPGLVLTAAG